jgi:hypothetical protein
VNTFFKVEMAVKGWGLLVNEGSTEEPRFRVILIGTEQQMERVAADMNEKAMAERAMAMRRHD